MYHPSGDGGSSPPTHSPERALHHENSFALTSAKNQSLSSVRGITKGFSERLEELKSRNKGLEDNVADLEADRDHLRGLLQESQGIIRQLEDENNANLETIDGLRAKLSYNTKLSSRSHSAARLDADGGLHRHSAADGASADGSPARGHHDSADEAAIANLAVLLEEAEGRAGLYLECSAIMGHTMGEGNAQLVAIVSGEVDRLAVLQRSLEEDVRESKAGVAAMHDQCADYARECEALRAQLEEAHEAHSKDVADMLSTVESVRAEARRSADAHQDEAEAHEKAVANLQKQLKDATSVLASSDAANVEAREQLTQQLQDVASKEKAQRLDNATLREECAQLERQLADVTRKLSSEQRRSAEEAEQVAAADAARSDNIAALEKRIRDQSAEMSKVQEEAETHEKAVANLQKQLKDATSVLSSSDAANVEAREQLTQQLQDVASKEKALRLDNATLREECAQLERQLADVTRKLSSEQRRSAEEAEQVAAADAARSDKIAALEKRIRDQSAEMSKVQEEVSSANALVEAERRANARLQGEVRAARVELDEVAETVADKLRRKELEADAFKKRLAIAEEDLRSAQDAHNALQEKERRLVKDIASARAERDGLQSLLEQERGDQQLSTERRRHQLDAERALRSENDGLRQSLEDAKDSLQRLEGRYKKLEAELSEAEHMHHVAANELTTVSAEKGRLQKDLASARGEIQALREEKDTLGAALEKQTAKAVKTEALLARSAADGEGLAETIATLERERDHERSRCNALQGQLKGAEAELEESVATVADLRKSLQSRDATIRQVQAQHEASEAQRISLEKQQDALTDQLEKQATKAVKTEALLARSAADGEGLAETIATLERERDHERSRCNALQGQLKGAEAELEESVATVADLRKSLQSRDATIRQVQAQHEASEAQRISLEKQQDAMTDQLAKAVEEQMTLSNAVAELEEQHEALVNDLGDNERQQVKVEAQLQATEARASAAEERARALEATLEEVTVAHAHAKKSLANSEQRIQDTEYELVALQHASQATAETGAMALSMLVELESRERFTIATARDGDMLLMLEVFSQRRRSLKMAKELGQKRSELERFARERDGERNSLEDTVNRLQQEVVESRDVMGVLEHASSLSAVGHGCMTEYLEGRLSIQEDFYYELLLMVDKLPRAQSATESRARVVLSLIGSPHSSPTDDEAASASVAPYLAQLKAVSQSHRAIAKELSLYKHMYHAEKGMEAKMLTRAMGRLGMRGVDGGAASPSAVALALGTLESDEESTRRTIATAYMECLTAIGISMIPLLEPLHFMTD